MAMPSAEVIEQWNVDDVPFTFILHWVGIDDADDQSFILELLGATGEESYVTFGMITPGEVAMVTNAERDGRVLHIALKG